MWTYNYYDGWVPNYMFWIGVTHNSIGRFYETQSYRRRRQSSAARARRAASGIGRTRRRPTCTWGPRNNVNMQQSALLLAMNYVAKNKETFLENYYLKNKHTIERGKTKAPYAYVVPARQRRRVEAAELMNLIRREGAEVHVADAAFTLGSVEVAPATTSSGSISPTAPSSKRCSACSSTRRRTRGRTTTPAGPSRSCATSRATASKTRRSSRSR